MKQNHTRVFFIETAFLTLFVLLALTVLVQVFGKARQLGEQAAHTSAAALILQNVDADLQAGAGVFAALTEPSAAAQSFTICYNAEGEQDADGAYRVQVRAEPASAGKNGRYWTAEIVISDAEQTTRYTVANTACYYKKGAA